MVNCKCFSKIDLQQAYHQVPVHQDSVQKTAVMTPNALYEYLFKPYGLKTAGQTFSRFMQIVLGNFDFVLVYVDDILVFSKTFKQHIEHLEIIFKRLIEFNLSINLNKSEFNKKEVEFLGYTVNCNDIMPSKSRIKVIEDYPLPVKVKHIKKFLGMMNYYNRFFDNLAKIQAPLNHFRSSPKKSNNKQIRLSSDELDAFNQMKQALIDSTLLAHPIPGAVLVIHTDASSIALSGVLSQ